MVGATAVSASRASAILPSSSGLTIAAAPTTAISIACRYSSRMYALPERPAPGARCGTVTADEELARLSRRPPGPWPNASDNGPAAVHRL